MLKLFGFACKWISRAKINMVSFQKMKQQNGSLLGLSDEFDQDAIIGASVNDERQNIEVKNGQIHVDSTS